eukprot:TRINITY_DN14512_c2_g1_i1.p1 TRINITY_DN14512_c2_g1~~TRINITY_DN14512_c2_g1_i1.p1  ORF type:complete len:386 (+),score=43.80 TRINITY_DN14512_c2_g1_i1:68-1225(+)
MDGSEKMRLVLGVTAGIAGISWLMSRMKKKEKRQILKVHAITGDQGGGKLAGWSFSSEVVPTFSAMLDEGVCLTSGVKPPSDAEILIGGFPTEDQLKTCSDSLKSIIVPFAGMPSTTGNLVERLGLDGRVTVHNVHHNAVSTAEMAVSLCLCAAKQILPVDQRLRQGDWSPRGVPAVSVPDPWPQVTLHKKVALVLGYGYIGKRVAAVLSALGMKVHALRASCSRQYLDGEILVHPAADLEKLLGEVTVLIICLPGTSQTDGLIGKKQLDMLPNGAVLVNVGRGQIVDEDALYETLSAGDRLFAVGLDCWYNYPSTVEERTHTPVSKKYNFEQFSNVVMSPHRAGAVGNPETEMSRLACIAELVNRAVSHGPWKMANRVSLEKGY